MSEEPDEERPFSPEERAYVRGMIEREKRFRWLTTGARIWAGYISGAIISAYAVYTAWTGFFKKSGL